MKLSNYYKPTPAKWRKLGDAFLAVGGMVTMGGIAQYDELIKLMTPKEVKITLLIFAGCCVAGKFITNLFKEPDPTATEKGKGQGFGEPFEP